MKIFDQKEKQRKLQEATDDDDDDDDGISLDEPQKNISANDAMAAMNRITGNNNLPYQIKKFYGFKQNLADQYFTFNMIFSFINKMIARIIKYRLRILYSSRRLRNLQEARAQSVTATCNIIDSSQAGKIGTGGEELDYQCQAPKESGMVVSNINLDTTYSMQMDGELIHFDDVNFSEEAAKQANNITAATGSPNSLDEPPKNISASDATAPMKRNTGNKGLSFHIKKFYGFKQNLADPYFNFNMIFSFINKMIARIIKYRLRILYSSRRLRNLQEAEAQSVTADCNITDSSLVGKNGTGEEIDYKCQAPKGSGREVSNINLDTTEPIYFDGNEESFDDVNFEDEAANQANNITSATGGNLNKGRTDLPYQIKKFYGFKQTLTDPYFNFNMIFSFKNKLIARIITFTLRILYSSRRLRNLQEAAAQSVKATCNIMDSNQAGKTGTGEEEIDYKCQAPKESGKEVSDVKPDTTEPIYFDGNEESFNNVNFEDEAYNQADNIAAATEGSDSTNFYKKSSSGLSGGAIAGIVIACAVVVIAVAIAIIMFRKPSPPIDNSATEVDLKHENI